MLCSGAQGAAVFVPLGHSPDYDLVADWGEGAMRVQVKTSPVVVKNRWRLAVCTMGGNQSWNGLVKRLDPSRYDASRNLCASGSASSFFSVWFSICRIRSRVTLNARPTSSSV